MSSQTRTHIRPLVTLVLALTVFILTPIVSFAAQATLAWDPNDPVPEGYRIYQRSEGQAYNYDQPAWSGSLASGTVEDLADDINYFFVVRAYDGDQESSDSNEVAFLSPAPTVHSITASAGPNGSISPEGSLSVDHNGSRTFIITPDDGYHVSDVKVDGVSKGSLAAYTFNQVTTDRTIEAFFSQDTYTVPQTAQATLAWDANDPAPEGYRIYQRSEGDVYNYEQPVWTGSVASGTVYNLNYGTTYYFVVRAYDGDQESTDSNEVTFFAQSPPPASHTITVIAGGNGAISPADSVTVDHGGSQTFAISPDTGYHVADVKVDGLSKGAMLSYTFNQVDADHTFEAVFAVNTYSIGATASAGGSISPSGATSVNYGAGVTYTINPNAGYHIADVKVDGVSVGAGSTYTFGQISANHTIDASFAIDTHTLTASAAVNGTISPAGTANVDYGASATYTITADAGYHVEDVTVDGVSMGAVTSYSFAGVASDHTIAASFAIDTFMLSAVAGVNGSISPAGAVCVDCGTSTTYTITPDTGYQVSDVKIDGQSMGALESYTFADVSADHTLIAEFEATMHTLTASAGGNGTVSPSGSIEVSYGESRTFTFSADAGFHVADVLVDGQSVGAVDSYSFSNVAGDHGLAVSFAENTDVAIWIEAEDGDLQWPMEINDDVNASAGGFVWVPTGNGDLTIASEDAGMVTYHFDVPETGDYIVWGRQVSNDSASDSFFVAMDGNEPMVWHTLMGASGAWTWDAVAIRDAANPDYAVEPMHFRLSAGAHTLTVYQREDGTMLDQLLITNQLDMASPDTQTIAEMMEFGEIQIDHNWKRVELDKTYTNPVVVAGPISLNGGHPSVVRIRNVDSTGFDIRIQEWDYLDGWHTMETVSYLVMEQGTYTLGDGTRIEASNLETGAVGAFESIAFKEAFNVKPVVMTTVSSFNDADAVTGRVKYITTDGFSYRFQEQDSNVQDHGTETVAYIAWEPSMGLVGDTLYRVDRTDDAVTHKNYNIAFDSLDAPVSAFLADMQTTDGGDTANVRCDNRGSLSVDVLIDEEQSKDSEVNHTSEIVGFMMFGDLM